MKAFYFVCGGAVNLLSCNILNISRDSFKLGSGLVVITFSDKAANINTPVSHDENTTSNDTSGSEAHSTTLGSGWPQRPDPTN